MAFEQRTEHGRVEELTCKIAMGPPVIAEECCLALAEAFIREDLSKVGVVTRNNIPSS